MIGLTSFELGVIEVVIVVLAFEILGTGDADVGLLNAALGIGSIGGVAAQPAGAAVGIKGVHTISGF